MTIKTSKIAAFQHSPNVIQRIEAGKRFVTDIELVHLARVFHVSCGELLHLPASESET